MELAVQPHDLQQGGHAGDRTVGVVVAQYLLHFLFRQPVLRTRAAIQCRPTLLVRVAIARVTVHCDSKSDDIG